MSIQRKADYPEIVDRQAGGNIMFMNESTARLTAERSKDLRREADRERLAKEARQPQRKTAKKSPLWTRVWTLL